MRYVEHWMSGLALALCIGGCASNSATTTLAAADPAVAPAKAARAASAASAAAAAAPPVDPAAQRAFDEARRALAAGQLTQAERDFQALTHSHPQLAGPHAGLGLIHLQAGKVPQAIAELELAVGASPNQPVYLNQLGVAYRQHGRFDKARQAYEKALELAPEHAEAVLNLGILNDLYLGDRERALELYERYMQLRPQGDAVVGKWVIDLKNRKPQTLAAKGTP